MRAPWRISPGVLHRGSYSLWEPDYIELIRKN